MIDKCRKRVGRVPPAVRPHHDHRRMQPPLLASLEENMTNEEIGNRHTSVEGFRFGFLPCKWSFEFQGGSVAPVPEYKQAAAWVDRYTNLEDSFTRP